MLLLEAGLAQQEALYAEKRWGTTVTWLRFLK